MIDELIKDKQVTGNPLMAFARKPECSVKLPTNGSWYDEGLIEYNNIGEVDVLPLLPADEVLMLNPDALLSGTAIINVIRSCCPSIKNPEELYYPDVNTLLLAIRKATRGNELKHPGICPKCYGKKLEIENNYFKKLALEKELNVDLLSDADLQDLRDEAEEMAKDEVAALEESGEIMLHQQENTYSIDELLQKVKMLPKECVVETKDGLKIYVTPYKCSDKIKFTNTQIQMKHIYKYYNKNLKMLDKIVSEQDMDKAGELMGMYKKLSDLSIDVVVACVKKIALPDGTVVDDKAMIKEFMENTTSELIGNIREKLDELNDCGIPQSLSMKCQCCNHEWEEKFNGYNQSDFFGIGS